MEKPPRRIENVATDGPTSLTVTWQDGGQNRVDLAGWIGTGGKVLGALSDPAVFSTAAVAFYGNAVQWAEDDDLAIDSTYLDMLADQQAPIRPEDLNGWQEQVGMSNQEAAEFFGIALSTWNGYKAGGNIPASVQMLCRAVRRDPVLMAAHYRPRKPGRPVKERSAAR